jgi:hypothetical protein
MDTERFPRSDVGLAAVECVEIRLLLGSIETGTAAKYVRDLDTAKRFSPQGNRTAGRGWTRGAPRVEELTPEWQGAIEHFRISDREAYAWQMRRLLGLH